MCGGILTQERGTNVIVSSVLQLNVTADPDLPSNLTYNCSFSGSGDIFPLVVPAVEVVTGSLYQCNITAAITDLNSVKEGLLFFFLVYFVTLILIITVTDFSFVSVEVGVSFAVSENALTIYDCPEATRYKYR